MIHQHLRDCVSPDTAHITFEYPYGRGRCLKRTWIETAAKGTHKGGQRICAETTHPSFNQEYTERLAAQGKPDTEFTDYADVNEWVKARLAAGTIPWNAAKCSTYSLVLAMYVAPLAPDDDRPAVHEVHLNRVETADIDTFLRAVDVTSLTQRQQERIVAMQAVITAYQKRKEAANA